MKFLNKLSNKKLNICLLCLVLGIFLLANILGSVATDKLNLKFDITDQKLYELSAVTKDVSKNLDENVTIYVFSSENDYPQMLAEVILRIAKLSSKISLEYVDPYANPVLVDFFKQNGFSIIANDVIVQGAKRIKQIGILDMVVTDYSGENIEGIAVEQQIASALLYVNSDKQPMAVFSDGHNERPSNALYSVFTKNNYEVKKAVLSVNDIAGADVFVIASPTRDFEVAEIAKVEEFLENGGKLMVFIEPSSVKLSNIEKLLNKWNIAVNEDIVFEQTSFVSNNPINVVPQYYGHKINEYFIKNRYYMVAPSARSLTLIGDSLGAISTSAVLFTSNNSYSKVGVQFNSNLKENNDKTGPFILSATSEKKVRVEGEEKIAKIFVMGSRNVYGDDIMGVSTYANSDFFNGVINYLSPENTSINIPTKNVSLPPLSIKLSQSFFIGAILIFILPVGVFTYGVFVFLKRRKL